MNIHDVFQAQVERTPDQVAVVFGRERLTYAELNRRANRVGHRLRQLGVGPEVPVAICVNRSVDLVAGLLGILKAGGAYLPLDPAYPRERLVYMVQDAGAPVLLTHRKVASLPLKNSHRVLLLEEALSHDRPEHRANPTTGVQPDDLAYVIYTSGSSGQPKGVQISHRAVVNLLASLRERPGLTSQDVQVVVASISFDLSVSSILLPLSVGARAVIASRERAADGASLSRLLDEVGATALEATPATWRLLLAGGWRGRERLKMISTGETLPRSLAEQLLPRGASLWNLYGPTEATVFTTVCRVESGDGPVPLGDPIANVEIHLLDRGLNPVPAGETGQLYIGGAGLARGYVGRAGLTAERFIPDPFHDLPASRLHATGDLVRRCPDGTLELLGRADHQVKVRGYRIELGEVESALACHPSVQAAAAQASDDASGGKRLVAYVVPDGTSAPTAKDLRAFLARKLPDYMVPSEFVFLAELPLTSSGKVDRQQLSQPPPVERQRDAPPAAPGDSTERAVARIWSEVLEVNRPSSTDDFSDSGGHSLKAAQIIARIREELGIELSMSSFHGSPTIAGLAHLVHAGEGKPGPGRSTEIPRAPRVGPLPLSFAQERVWFIQQLAPGTRAYHFQSTSTFTGRLDLPALERSLGEIVRRHEIYRTTFHEVEGNPTQSIHDPWRVHLASRDLRRLPEAERACEAERILSEECQRPFQLSELPLVRWSLIRVADDQHVLAHVEHHLVHDGWSFRLFVRELLELYKAFSSGQPSPLPDPPIQMVDFARWERQWAGSEDAAANLEYWTKALQDCPACLALPLDRPRPPVPTFQGASFRMDLPPRLCQSLRALCRRQKVTLYSLLLSAFSTLLYRYTGQEDVSIGCAVANRHSRQLEQLMGMVVNNVVLRCEGRGLAYFRDVLAGTQQVLLEAQEHSLTPFDRVVASLGRGARDLSHNPLFQVMFNMHDGPLPAWDVPELEVELREVLTNRSSKFDLDVVVIPGSTRLSGSAPARGREGIALVWEYSTDLFEDTTVARMARHYEALLESIVADPDRRLDDLSMLTEAERHQLLVEWNDTARDYPASCIHEFFEASARSSPDDDAVVCGRELLSYSELNARANQLAHYLRRHGVGPGSLVAICLERSPDLIVGLLAVLKAGAAYVPLDHDYPPERREFLLSDSGASLMLTQHRWRGEFIELEAGLVCVDAERRLIRGESEANPNARVTPDSPAYVIYTSGSTGRPNGVCIEHRCTANLLHWAREVFEPESLTRVLASSSICFDLSAFEIFAPLAWGGAVILVRDASELLTLPPEANPTLVNTVPSVMAELLRLGRLPATVRTVNLAGEPLPSSLVRKVYQHSDAKEVFDLYGPTECTTYATFALRQADAAPTIGRPIANTQAYVLDHNLRPVPVGVPGQLYLGGVGLAGAYWRRPDLTREKFLPNPFTQQSEARLYRTGDQVRYRRDGNLEFLGRGDNQVKVRGFRIELGEIESALRDHPAVRAAAVVVREDEPGERRLVAYVVLLDGPAPSAKDLRSFLEHRLPRYMLPSWFQVLAALPFTPNGKIDRDALPQPQRAARCRATGPSASHTGLERQLTSIWEAVLGAAPISNTDNFFELGGDSLDAVRVVNRIESTLGKQVGLAYLFHAPTIEQLARVLESGTNSS